MEKGKRHCSDEWTKKKKMCKARPVELVSYINYSRVKPGLEDWEIVFRACEVVSKWKESKEKKHYKIVLGCGLDVAGVFFKLTSKAEKLDALIEVL